MSAIATPVDDRQIESHVKCLACGYDLFATRRAGLCPECGGDVTFSLEMAEALGEPASVSAARRMARMLLVSSIFAGLCPASCLLMLNIENAFGAVLMTIAFAICAVFAALGERARRQIHGLPTSGFRGSPLVPDIIAAGGLLLVNLAAYLYGIANSHGFGRYETEVKLETISAACVGFGFFLLCVTAWRAMPTWRAHADVARILHAGRLVKMLTFLAWVKAIYETIWLACCWTPFALMGLRSSGRSGIDDLAVYPAVAAAFGLIGFAVIWILMIIAHSILLVQIQKQSQAIAV